MQGLKMDNQNPQIDLRRNFRVEQSDATFACFFIAGEARESQDLDTAYEKAINDALEQKPLLLDALRDIIAASDANDGGSLMDAIEHAKTLVPDAAPDAAPD